MMTNTSGITFKIKPYLPDQPFVPSWWCPGAHVQTIFARFFRPFPKLALVRKRIQTPDDDFFDIDFLEGKPEAPCVVILHGLAGASDAPYVQSLLAAVQEKGWTGVAMNYRGCSGELNKQRTTYHSGKTDDLDLLIRNLREQFKNEEMYVVGFSIGGNILLKWLGENTDASKSFVNRAIAVSVPYDLTKSVELLDKGFNCEVYTRSLLQKLRADTRIKMKQFPDLVDGNQLQKCRTFTEFDSLVTAPLNGFKDAPDYWYQSSSRYFLKSIQVPTLLIHAHDDPFFTGEHLPMEAIGDNANLQLLLTEKGGHLGFVAGGVPLKQEPWIEREMVRFLSSDE